MCSSYNNVNWQPFCKSLILICCRKYYFFKVSWIRKRDLHILTMGSTVYSNDRRVQVVHPNRTESSRNNNRDDWLLHIHQAQPSDSGIYECQINTEPKRSKAYVLNVVGELKFMLTFIKE